MKTTDVPKGFLGERALELVNKTLPAQSKALAASRIVKLDGEAVHTLRVPVVEDDPKSAWTAEGTEIQQSRPQVGEISTPLRKIAGLTVISTELATDTNPAAEEIIVTGLSRDLGRRIDAAYFGSNVGNETVQPPGLEDLEGVTEIAAGAAWANMDPFIEAGIRASTFGADIGMWALNPADLTLLANLKLTTEANVPMLMPDTNGFAVGGAGLVPSEHVTVGTVWGIPKDLSIVGMRTGEIVIDRSAFFTSDRVAIRSTLRVGWALPHPAAVMKITVGS